MLRRKSLLGKVLRFPFTLIPDNATISILSGVLKGYKWIKGSHNISILFGIYEKNQTRKFYDSAAHSNVFWDLGAHVGYYSLLFNSANTKGALYAFEPVIENSVFYRKHMLLNNISHYNLFVVAVSNQTGELSFSNRRTSVSGQLSKDGNKKVQVIKLSDWLKSGRIEKPDLIKMDIEGEEINVLLDIQELLITRRPVLFLSTHGKEIHKKCITFLQKMNYSLQPLDSTRIETSREVLAF